MIQSPTNDISGLRNLSASDQKRMALRSSKETVRIAKRAMNQFGCKVIILARPRRGDSVELEKLNRMSNDHLCKLIEEEPRLTYDKPTYNKTIYCRENKQNKCSS